MTRLWTVLAFLLFLAPAPAQVLTVGPSGADFTEIQPAVDAAPVGATVLVAPGNYAGFVLTKAVDVLGPVTGDAIVTGVANEVSAIIVRDLIAGSTALVSGFQVESGPTCCLAPIWGGSCGCTPIVLVENCLGSVTLNALAMNGTDGAASLPMEVSGSTRVHLMNCTLMGEGYNGSVPSAALIAENSHLIISNSVLVGGSGIWGSVTSSYGETAIVMDGGSLELSNSRVIGGDGGSWKIFGGPMPGIWTHSYGSPAIEADSATLFLRGGPEGLVRPGAGPCEGSCLEKSPSVRLTNGSTATVMGDLVVYGGEPPEVNSSYNLDGTSTVVELPGFAPTLTSVESAIAVGGQVDLTLSGEPNAGVRIFWSGGLGADFTSPGLLGTVILDLQNFTQFGAVLLDGSGTGNLSVTMPSAPAFVGFSPTIQGLQIGGTASFTNPWTISLQ